ncbi:MAG: phosphoribosylamine--glycine ligase [Acidimicrobiales bacterium]|jgi:phosphoribosylamine--glycine ligase
MTTKPFRILLFGKDARTDAIAEGARSSPSACELTICAPFRSPGLVRKADRFLTCSLTDLDAMASIARDVAPDLVVVGPEDPLSVGLADAMADLGVPCFGPTRALARLETSKSWTRALVEQHGIEGNPRHRTFHDPRQLAEYASELGSVVVKPDGLTGGKGVKVQGEQLETLEDAVAYALSLLDSDGSVVIEERLVGEEFSLQTITDGTDVIHCPIAQDHKRAYDGDVGPNTGGMGSYSCADGSLPFLSAGDVALARRINEDTIEALSRESSTPYRGVVYGGFMAVADGVRLIEYNARFGDPEALNVLPLLEGDLVELLLAAATGRLGGVEASFAARATVCKYVVPSSYPEAGTTDGSISTDDSPLGPELRCYWAAAELQQDGSVRLTGSRGLAFVGIADTVSSAEALAEGGAASVSGMVRHRRDIGTPASLERRVEHMRTVRPRHTA